MTNRHLNLFKPLLDDGIDYFHDHKWILPSNGQNGIPCETQGELVLNENGLHLCRAEDLIYYLYAAPHIFRVEYEGDIVVCPQRVLASKAWIPAKGELNSWDEISQRLFACDCASLVLDNIQEEYRFLCANLIKASIAYAIASSLDMAANENYFEQHLIQAREKVESIPKHEENVLSWQAVRAALITAAMEGSPARPNKFGFIAYSVVQSDTQRAESEEESHVIETDICNKMTNILCNYLNIQR